MSEIELRNKFKELMFTLDVYYTHFKFFDDTEERVKAKLRVWYESLKAIPSDRLEYVVHDYCKNNVYPPTSPTSLIDHYKSLVLNYYPNAEEEFEKLIQRYRYDVKFDLKLLHKKYNRYPYIQKTIERMQSDFESFKSGQKELQYLKLEFVKTYNIVIQEQVEEEKLKLE